MSSVMPAAVSHWRTWAYQAGSASNSVSHALFTVTGSACAALAKHAEHNEVVTVLVNLIREQLDEIGNTAYPGELTLPLMDDLPEEEVSIPLPREDAPDPAEIRKYGRELLARGAGIVPAIRMILEHYGMRQKEFATLIGTSETTISTALAGGVIRPSLLCRMTEFFGDGKED